MSFLLAEENTS